MGREIKLRKQKTRRTRWEISRVEEPIVQHIKECFSLSCGGCDRDISDDDCWYSEDLNGFWHEGCAREALNN